MIAERVREGLPAELRPRYFVWAGTRFVRLGSLAR